MIPTVVYDCMIFLQAAANPLGPSGRCLDAVEDGLMRLVMSQVTRYEVHDVLTRSEVRSRLPHLTDARVTEIVAFLDYFAVSVPHTTRVGPFARDVKDEKYLNLAVAANAAVIVSRDNDLLDLMTASDPDAVAFRTAYPGIAVLDPPAFLATLPPDPSAV